MSDHEHVWGVTSGGKIVGVKAICVAGDCNETLDAVQIGRRLNDSERATKALSAEKAQKWYMRLHGERFREIALALHDYADALVDTQEKKK